MAQMSFIDYEDAKAGRIKKRRFLHPLGAYMAQRGATTSTNEFVDPNLVLGDDHFDNVLKIIRSAKAQGHIGVAIRLTAESSAAIGARILDMEALEQIEVLTEPSKSFTGIDKLTVKFR